MPTISKIATCAAALLLIACAASGPTYDEAGFGGKSITDGRARIVFLRTRDSGLYIARYASVSADGKEIGRAGYGSFFFHDVDAGDHRLQAGMWDMPGECELIFAAVAGETYFFQVDPRAEGFSAFVVGDMATQVITTNVIVNVVGGFSAVAAESYGKECGGAFRVYPLDAATAMIRLETLRLAQ